MKSNEDLKPSTTTHILQFASSVELKPIPGGILSMHRGGSPLGRIELVKIQRQTTLGLWLGAKIVEPGTIEVAWVAQAGFIIKSSTVTVGIDLYLSDSLAEKYKGKEYPHIRMMAPPLTPTEATALDLVLCTHGHTDHMDPKTLKPLYQNGLGPLCIGPRFEAEKMLAIGVPTPRIVGMSSAESFSLGNGMNNLCKITAIPAAHEKIETDKWGNTKALGYIIELAGITIYHSGDSLLYEGLEKTLKRFSPDLVLLPVNGRKEHLSAKGIAGNFSCDEACILAKEAGASFFIPHHFGLFDFNTTPEDSIASSLQKHGWETGTTALIPKIGEIYTFQK